MIYLNDYEFTPLPEKIRQQLVEDYLSANPRVKDLNPRQRGQYKRGLKDVSDKNLFIMYQGETTIKGDYKVLKYTGYITREDGTEEPFDPVMWEYTSNGVFFADVDVKDISMFYIEYEKEHITSENNIVILMKSGDYIRRGFKTNTKMMSFYNYLKGRCGIDFEQDTMYASPDFIVSVGYDMYINKFKE